MIIKHQTAFKLRPYGKTKTTYQIQLHVTFNGQRVVFSTGCQIVAQDAWDTTNQSVFFNYKGQKGETGLSINNTLRNCRDQIETTFKYFEVNEINPTKKQLTDKYQEKLKGIIPQKPKEEPQKKTSSTMKFFDALSEFVSECGEKNTWTEATYEKISALEHDLRTFKKDLKFADLSESGLTSFIKYLRDDKKLHTPRKKKGNREDYDHDDVTGLKNSTIEKKLDCLKWFLKWSTNKGYNTNIAYKTFHPTLKTTQKKVIYLTKTELKLIKDLKIPTEAAHLEQTRDVLLFCCFSGLRHSDVYNLRRNDIKGSHIEITTMKTADSISIELNSITSEILEKYKDFTFKGDKALPVISNQPMNRDLKELCRLAGINEKIRITTYKGNQRIDETKEKWELIGTHTGRRTFIVNCLSLGIAPNVVMKWTGHSDYKSMKPYIDIVDTIKASEMTKLNSIL